MKKFISVVAVVALSFSTINISFAESPNSTSLQKCVTGLNQFTFKLFQETATKTDNSVISPYSLSSLFGLLLTGADGNTKTQLLQLLQLNDLDVTTDINPALKQINATMLSGNHNLIIANALWGDKTLKYQSAFLETTQNNPYVQFYTEDFLNNASEATDIINEWVAKKTTQLITQLIPQGAITAETKLVLTNAIYFKGLWETPFDIQNTQPAAFTLPNNQLMQVPTMHNQEYFKVGQNNLLQYVELPYSKDSLAMIILLPKANHSLDEIKAALNQTYFSTLLAHMGSKEVSLSLPKFNIDSTFDSLNQPIMSMGLTDAFTDKADFSKLSESPISISEIIQKAKITVDEKGTVAAAASGMIMRATAYTPPIIFNADHPFIFVIYDTETKLVLFIGQEMNPK